MKVSKAIEIMEYPDRNMKGQLSPDFKDALKLGIEALKLIQRERLLGINPVEPLLPEETPE